MAGTAFLALAGRPACARYAHARPEDSLRLAHRLGIQLRAGEITTKAWQEQMARVFAPVDVGALLRVLEVERVLAGVPKVDKGARVVPVGPNISRRQGVVMKIFAFDAGRANPPHAHDNMASMHLVLRGRFRVRHYARLGDTPSHIRITPSIDRVLEVGEHTSVTDEADNVHWHRAETAGILLDVLVTDVAPNGPRTRTHLLDIDRAVQGDEAWLAPRIDSLEQALEAYG